MKRAQPLMSLRLASPAKRQSPSFFGLGDFFKYKVYIVKFWSKFDFTHKNKF